MPQNCDLPRAEKNKWIISTGSFNIVSVQPKPVLTDVCAKIVLPLFASTISTSLSSCISPSLSQPPHPSSLSSEAWLTWEHMSSLRQLSGLASGRVEKRKRENFKVLRVGSQRIMHSELGEHSLPSMTKKKLYQHATVCSATFCLVWHKCLQQSHLWKWYA